MKILILRGKQNSGKTTIFGLLYKELLKVADTTNHTFNHRKVVSDSLKFDTQNETFHDFTAVITISGKVVVMISAGDVKQDLENSIIAITAKVAVDILICCTRSQFRSGSTFELIEKTYRPNNEIIGIEWVKRLEPYNEGLRMKFIDNIITKLRNHL